MLKKISILVVSLLWVGCSSKKCGPNDYDGLFNAILCDYEGMNKDRKQELYTKTLEKNKLFHKFQMLIALVTKKEEKLTALQEQISEIENDLSVVNNLLSKVNKNKVNSNTIVQLKKRLKKMNRNILNQSTFFSVEDASYANVKLLENSDKQKFAKAYGQENTDKLKYAQAYNKKSLDGTKFAKAYNQDMENSKKIKIALSQKISKLSDVIDSENISSKKTLLTELMSDVENYKNTIKGS